MVAFPGEENRQEGEDGVHHSRLEEGLEASLDDLVEEVLAFLGEALVHCPGGSLAAEGDRNQLEEGVLGQEGRDDRPVVAVHLGTHPEEVDDSRAWDHHQAEAEVAGLAGEAVLG